MPSNVAPDRPSPFLALAVLLGAVVGGAFLAWTPYWPRDAASAPSSGSASNGASAESTTAAAASAAAMQVAALQPSVAPQRGLVASARDAQRHVAWIAPSLSFHLAEGEALHPLLAPSFEVLYRGALRVAQSGRHRFRTGVEASLRLGGELVNEQGIELPSGWIALELRVSRNAPGAAAMRFEWSGPGFAWEAVPSSALAHFERDEESSTALLVARGRAAFEELGCGSCHASDDASLESRRGPRLTRVGARASEDWIERWLAEPHTFRPDASMPALALDDAERADLAAYLGHLGGPIAPMRAARGLAEPAILREGAEAFQRIGCATCHTAEKHALRELGSKTNVDALTAFLIDPLAVDPSGRMPACFGEAGRENASEAATAKAIATYLTRDPELNAQGFSAEPRQAAPDAVRGERLLEERGCLACHECAPTPRERAQARGSAAISGAKLTAWRALGPFALVEQDFAKPLAPELDAFAAERYADGFGGEVRWREAAELVDGAVHTLAPERDHAALFLERELLLEERAMLVLELRCDDFFVLAIDGEALPPALKNSMSAPVRVEKLLEPGTHRLRWKLGDRAGNWRFRCDVELHDAKLAAPLENRLRAPALVALPTKGGCLEADASAPAARYSLSEPTREALRAFLAARAWTAQPSPAPIFAARSAIERHGCESCHTPLGAKPAPGLDEVPPPLELAGEKLRESAVRAIFEKRTRARSYLGVRMPHFGAELGAVIARGLAAERGLPPGDGVEPPKATLAESARGVQRLGTGEANFACTSCHDYKQHVATGERGPDLTGMHARIRPEWFAQWLREPARLRPGTSMPAFLLGRNEESSSQIIRELWGALALRENLPPPPGLAADLSSGGERAPTVRPLHYRCFLPECTPSSFAVALPGLFSFAWDPAHSALRYAWIGDFLDMRPQWQFKGETFPVILGEVFARPALDHGLGLAGSAEKRRFRGYRLEQGIPTFLWSQGALEVRERWTASEDGGALRVRFEWNALPTSVAVIWKKPTLVGVELRSADGVERDGAFTPRDAQQRFLTLELRPTEVR
ncbi:MAG: c-type cytochrome [Planctomycetes bacterium]|nr:c-type cytochrome [Planctomycetota bacterium]